MTSDAQSALPRASGPLDDLALTLPIFVGYHLGVVFLPTRNAADLVTHELVTLAEHSLFWYAALTLGIGLSMAGIFLSLGREQTLSLPRFGLLALEGVIYAALMRLVASGVVGRLHLDGGGGFAGAGGVGELGARAPGAVEHMLGDGPLGAVVLSLGAGLYEEIAFRVLLFGVGLRLLAAAFSLGAGLRRNLFGLVWAVVAAAVFSGWHYVGQFGEVFELRSFTFRWVCGVVFTVIYVFRGFAPAVWTHALYDIWVLVL